MWSWFFLTTRGCFQLRQRNNRGTRVACTVELVGLLISESNMEELDTPQGESDSREPSGYIKQHSMWYDVHSTFITHLYCSVGFTQCRLSKQGWQFFRIRLVECLTVRDILQCVCIYNPAAKSSVFINRYKVSNLTDLIPVLRHPLICLPLI